MGKQQKSHDIPELPSDQSWMRDVSIGDIPPTERDRLTELLHSNQQVFAQNESDVGLTHTVKHRICITEELLPYQSFGYSLRCLIPSRHCIRPS